MLIKETSIPGCHLIELEKRGDSRGFFARQFCQKELEEVGIEFQLAQANTSFSADKGTLRGLHYQLSPSQETKIIRCIRGSIWDCVLDIRPDSPKFGSWIGVELTSENRTGILVPKGCAHGFLSLSEDSEILYLVDEFYDPDRERGVRWNDPRFDIGWPFEPTVISERDQNHPDFSPEHHLDTKTAQIPS
jgi:dTDP-4-dehydrorhamnose 3,5-epimerase